VPHRGALVAVGRMIIPQPLLLLMVVEQHECFPGPLLLCAHSTVRFFPMCNPGLVGEGRIGADERSANSVFTLALSLGLLARR